jgi:hypothetical protein
MVIDSLESGTPRECSQAWDTRPIKLVRKAYNDDRWQCESKGSSKNRVDKQAGAAKDAENLGRNFDCRYFHNGHRAVHEINRSVE